MRVVSLVPSVTETLLAWGIEPVACTRFCEQPNLKHVGGTKDPNIDEIVRLAPDVVVVEREENRKVDAESLVARGINVVDLHVTALYDVGREMAKLARAVGVSHAGDFVLKDEPAAPRIIAFVPIWRRPWMTINAATYGASLLAHLGVVVSHSSAEKSYPELENEDLAKTGASIVLLPTEPYIFANRHFAEVKLLTGISDVRIIDGKDLFWWGHRSAEAVERLAHQLGDVG